MPNDDDIRAKTPDGAIHRFPVGTPPAIVDGAIKKYLSAQSTGVDLGELQQRTMQQSRATAARPIVSGELNNPASPNFNRPLPGSFEGKPENVGDYVPNTVGEMAGGTADIGRGDIAKGTHRIIGGASNALLPVSPFAGAAAPALTARTLAGGALGQYAGIPSKAEVALALRNNETGAVKLPVKVGSAVLGAGTGYLTGLHGYGELGGMYLGPRAAEALIPKLPAEMPAKGIGAK